MRCWLCGVEPVEIVTINLPGTFRPMAQEPVHWPSGDHEHSLAPPSYSAWLAAPEEVRSRIRPISR